MTNSNISVVAKIEVTRQTIADTIAAAMEGGINYWARIKEYVHPLSEHEASMYSGLDYNGDHPNSFRLYKHIHYPMCIGSGAVVLEDCTGEDGFPAGCTGILDWDAVKRGVQVMAEKYPRHFANMVNDNGDAETGDTLVQCALFGELVFA